MTILIAATLGLEIRFVRNFQEGARDFFDVVGVTKEYPSFKDGVANFVSNPLSIFHSSEDKDYETYSENQAPFTIKQMGIPVVFVGDSGRCSKLTWARIGSFEYNSYSLKDERISLDYQNCKPLHLPTPDNPSDNFSPFLTISKVTTTSIQESPDYKTNNSDLTDIRTNNQQLLVVNLQESESGRKLKAHDRIVKLLISPQGGAELEMGRGLVIV